MNYKKMVVWSCGNETAKTEKINMIGYILCFILLCILHVIAFVCNPNDDKSIHVTIREHLSYGIMLLCLVGWLTALMLFMIKDSFDNIKENKLISLYLYKIEDFVKIGEIPEDKIILFSDKRGVVLADKKHKNESEHFSFGAKSFGEFENCYNKYAVDKLEIAK